MNAEFASLYAALERVPVGTQKLAVAYSGGLDSTALLRALVERPTELPVRAIHVCHHLQPAAKAWAEACARQAAAWEVGFTCIDVEVEIQGRSLEAAARDARYRALQRELGEGETLITAHHARDQAETFLLQALRGAGPRGLAGMPREAMFGPHMHWRPWLEIGYETIAAYARKSQLNWIDDPSNHDPDIARSFLRETVMPQLRSRWPKADDVLSRSAAHASEAATAIDTLAQIDLERVMESNGTLDARRLGALTAARAKQVVRRWLAVSARDRPDHRHVAAIVELGTSRLAASPCVSFADTEVRLFDGRLHAMTRLSPVGTPFEYEWNGCTPLLLPGGYGAIAIEPAPRVRLNLKVASRRGGERVASGPAGHRRVKDVLREARVPPWLRERVPLVYYRDTLVAVGDIWRHPHIGQLIRDDIGAFVWRDRPA